MIFILGILLLDEMKLSESVSFNKKTLKVNGLVNLGDYTPEHQQNSKGDHALVLMYPNHSEENGFRHWQCF